MDANEQSMCKVVDQCNSILFSPTELGRWLLSLTPILERQREEEKRSGDERL